MRDRASEIGEIRRGRGGAPRPVACSLRTSFALMAALAATGLAPAALAQDRATGAQASAPARSPGVSGSSGPQQQRLSPGLAAYTDEVLYGEVWPAEGLSPRDRSLVVVSALIATGKTAQLRGHLGRALTNGVTPVEASGILAHLALYSGWPSVVSSLDVYDAVFTERGIDLAVLQAETPALPPLADPSDIGRTTANVAPRFADLSTRIVDSDLWRRSDLNVRDRSLVTIATLTAQGEAALLAPYVRRGMAAGLTRDEIAEALTQLAFYVGWGKATLAIEALEAAAPQETAR